MLKPCMLIYKKNFCIKWKVLESLKSNKNLQLASSSVEHSKSKVKTENEYSSNFEIKTGVRRGDIISPTLFNIALDEAFK